MKSILWILFFAYITLLTKLILFKNQIGSVHYESFNGIMTFRQNLTRMNLVPFKTLHALLVTEQHAFIFQNIAGNIVGFMPLGFLVPLLLPYCRSLLRVTLMCMLVSGTYEIIQLFAVLGICDVDDLILNTLGGFAGYILYKVYRKYLLVFIVNQFSKSNSFQNS